MQSTLQKLKHLQYSIIDSMESMIDTQKELGDTYYRIEELKDCIQYTEDYTAKELIDMQEDLDELIQSIKSYQSTINDYEYEIKDYRGQAEVLTAQLFDPSLQQDKG